MMIHRGSLCQTMRDAYAQPPTNGLRLWIVAAGNMLLCGEFLDELAFFVGRNLEIKTACFVPFLLFKDIARVDLCVLAANRHGDSTACRRTDGGLRGNNLAHFCQNRAASDGVCFVYFDGEADSLLLDALRSIAPTLQSELVQCRRKHELVLGLRIHLQF
eukprot:29187_6